MIRRPAEEATDRPAPMPCRPSARTACDAGRERYRRSPDRFTRAGVSLFYLPALSGRLGLCLRAQPVIGIAPVYVDKRIRKHPLTADAQTFE